MLFHDHLRAADHERARGGDGLEERLQVGALEGHVAEVVLEREHGYEIVQPDLALRDARADAAEIQDTHVHLAFGQPGYVFHRAVHPPVGEFALRGGGLHVTGGESDDRLDFLHLRLHRDQVGGDAVGRAPFLPGRAVRGGIGIAVHRAERGGGILGTGHGHAGAVAVHPVLLPRVLILAGTGQQYQSRQRDYFCLNHFHKSFQVDFLPNIRMPTL